MEEVSEHISTDSDLGLTTPNSIENTITNGYDQACKEYSSTEVERTNNLNNMQKIIKRLLKKGYVSSGTQTDPFQPEDILSNSESL